jgi:hypothetical protein
MPLTGNPVSEELYGNFLADAKLPHCGVKEATAFLEAVAEESPFAQRALIERQVLPQFRNADNPEALAPILSRVAEMARQAGMMRPFERHDRSILDGPLRPFLDAVNDKGTGRRTVLFVVTTPYFVILREAMYLRREGHRVFLLSLSPLPENLRPLFARHFDDIADTRNGFRLLRACLSAATPDIVHVQCWMWMYVLGRLAIECCTRSKVVCEFYDATSLFSERRYMAEMWDPRLIDLDVDLERYILARADAVVSRYAPDVAEAWAAGLGVRNLRYLEFQPYPCREFSHYAEARPSSRDGVVRLVHAGTFAAPDGKSPPTIYPEISTPDVFRRLLEQGFALDVYWTPNITLDKLGPAYEPIRRMEREFERFRFLPGVPPDRFAETISGYDYGILLFDYDPAVAKLGPLWMHGVMPTRFFSYLEAGVPGIVVAEYEDMAGFLEDNGLGFGVTREQISDLARVIAGKDHARMVANIKAYNEAHGMHAEIGRLIGLYDGIESASRVGS